MAPLKGRGLALLRTLEIQAVWTYERMQGIGLGYALEPILGQVLNGDAARFQAVMGTGTTFFNANPYLSPAAVGALARWTTSTSTSRTSRPASTPTSWARS